MKLGDLVTDIEFSPDEIERLKNSFRNKSGAPYDVLIKHCADIQDNDFWVFVHKTMQITGYRPGKAKDKVLKSCLDSIDGSDPRANHVLFRLFRRCVTYYMNLKSKKLNTLLMKEEFKGAQTSTTKELFKQIVNLAPLYEVTSEEISYFYELWGFDRVDSFESLLEGKGLDIEVVRRYVGETLENYNEKLVEAFEGRISDAVSKVDKQDKFVEQLNFEVNEMNDKIASSIAVVRTELQNHASILVDKKISQLSADFKKISSGQKKDYEVNSGVNDEVIRLADKLNELSKRLNKIETKSPQVLNEEKIAIGAKPFSVNALSAFKELVADFTKRKVSNPDLVALSVVCELKSNSILFLNHFEIIEKFIHCFYKFENVKTIVAQPLWVTPEDWKKELTFLEEKHIEPRILIVQDFEIPLQDLYLIPAILTIRGSLQPGDKIILVKGDLSNSAALRLYDIGLEILGFDLKISDILEGKPTPSIADASIEKLLRDGLSLAAKHNLNLEIEENLRVLALNSNLTIQPSSMLSFSRLYDNLKIVIGDDLAFLFGLKLSLLVWIEKSFGEARRRVLEERVFSVMRDSENG